jgi:hypothetical protein
MVLFEYKGKSFYIDGRLDRDLRNKVYKDLLKNDKDNVFLIDGGEGTGKSKFGDILGAHAAKYLGCDYDLDSVCLSPDEFRNRIQYCPNGSVVIYDEAHRGMGSKRALSEINTILVDLMMEMRQKNLYVIIIMPTFFLLEKYAALFRSRGLFHVYERKRQRGFWVFFNEKNKKKLYILGKKLLSYDVMKYPTYRGRFYNQYCVDEQAYRAKKLRVFREKPSITRGDKFKEQRDMVMKLFYENSNMNKKEFSDLMIASGLNLKKTQINDIIKGKFMEESGKHLATSPKIHGIEEKSRKMLENGSESEIENNSISFIEDDEDEMELEKEEYTEKKQIDDEDNI